MGSEKRKNISDDTMYDLYLNMYKERNKRRKEKHDDDNIYLEKQVKKKIEEQTNLLSIKGIDRVDIKQKKGKHSIICIHYIKNMCMKNLFCNYLHQLIYSRIPTCKNFIKYNYCPDKVRGSCMFRHEIDTCSTFYSEHKDEYADDTLKFLHEKNICVKYLLGFCPLGYNCRKIHKQKSRKYSNLITYLPKFYLDTILVNKQLYLHLYTDPQKLASDANILKKVLLALSGEKGLEQGKTTLTNELEHGTEEKNRNNNFSNNHMYHGTNQIESHGMQSQRNRSNVIKTMQNNNTDDIYSNKYNMKHEEKGVNNDKSSSINNNHNNTVNTDIQNNKGYSEDQDENSKDRICIPNVYDLNNNLITHDRFKVFIIKCNQISNLYLSILYGVWATGKNNTRKFVNYFKENYTIIFLFSVNESGGFQGYAKMVTLPIKNLYDNLWGPISSRLGGNFRVQWIKTAKVDFDAFKNMVNCYNDNLPLKKSRDGTELPLHLASIICNKMHSMPDEDFLSGTIYEYKRRIKHSTYFSNLKKNKVLHTSTMWDFQMFSLNQISDCSQITYIDGTEKIIT